MYDSFDIPVIVTDGCPPDTLIMCHRDVITSVALSHAADRMAAHGIIQEALAQEIREKMERFIEREARAKRIGVITNIGTGR